VRSSWLLLMILDDVMSMAPKALIPLHFWREWRRSDRTLIRAEGRLLAVDTLTTGRVHVTCAELIRILASSPVPA
jgi:hypothetical protein